MTTVKALSLSLGFLVLWSCVGAQRIATTPPDPIAEAKLEKAATLFRKGCLVPLKKAYAIYRELENRPALRHRISLPLLETCLLIIAREKEMAIPGSGYIDEAARLIKENHSLADRQLNLEMAAMISPKTDGVTGDIDTDFSWKAALDKWEKRWDELKKNCSRDELSAYLFTAWYCSYGIFSAKKEDPADFLKIFPSSILLRYMAATCGQTIGQSLRKSFK